MSNPSITADKTPWYQWDTGLTVTVSGGEMNECHFANRKQGTAYVQAVINGIARVPDELLQVAAPIKAYGYVSDGAGGQTYVEQSFEVIARNIPSDYTYTKTAQKTIRDAEVARDEAVKAAKDAKASELAADDSAIESSKSAQSAGESASAAATSASNAEKSAGDAAKSASDAKAAASKTVEDASDLLKTYTDNAKTSADNAATSASNAADAASAASGSASASAQSATDASSAKVAAQTAKVEAATSASNAATSASNAAESAAAAAKSASDAAASVGAINVISPKTVGTAASSVPTSIAIGDGVTANFVNSVNVGGISKGSYSTVIGIGAEAYEGANASVAVGYQSIAYGINQFAVGGPERQREIVGVKDPTNKTSASTKKYTDDNDAKTLTEAKKYTDDNTTNALIGKVSGKLLHVEDAWSSKPLSVTINGAYKQDDTPSPENPAPITVIENPVLHVIGRNFVNVPNKTIAANSYGDMIDCDLIPANTTAYLSFTSSVDAVAAHHSAAACSLTSCDDSKNVYSLYYKIHKGVNKTTLTADFDASKHLTIFGYRMPTSAFDMSNYQLEVGGYHDYRAYTSVTLPITLPAEHPYLAALPDGTHDEMVIDNDGNVTLVARVQKVGVSNLPAPSAIDALDNGLTRYQYWGAIYHQAMNDTAALAPAFASVIDFAFPKQGMYVSNSRIIVGASADPTEALKAGGYVYTTLATPVTYNLGKVTVPALPESISNVYVSGELTPECSMTYKRDVNIVIADLMTQIAELKGTGR